MCWATCCETALTEVEACPQRYEARLWVPLPQAPPARLHPSRRKGTWLGFGCPFRRLLRLATILRSALLAARPTWVRASTAPIPLSAAVPSFLPCRTLWEAVALSRQTCLHPRSNAKLLVVLPACFSPITAPPWRPGTDHGSVAAEARLQHHAERQVKECAETDSALQYPSL